MADQNVITVKEKHKKEFEDIEFVSKYYKLIKSNLAELGYDHDEAIEESLRICDKNLDIKTRDYLTASVDFKAIQPHSKLEVEVKNLSNKEFIKVSEIANAIGVTSKRVNDILVDAELIVRKDKGTYVTPKGIEHGGTNRTVYGSSTTYVVWRPTILDTLLEILE